MLVPYDREELYREVWEKPLIKVAESYGVSAVALGKTCRKLRVPVPGRGHWAKLAYGKEGAKKPPLPKLDKIPVIYRSPIVQKKPATQNENDPEFAAINQLLYFRRAEPTASRWLRTTTSASSTYCKPIAKSQPQG